MSVSHDTAFTVNTHPLFTVVAVHISARITLHRRMTPADIYDISGGVSFMKSLLAQQAFARSASSKLYVRLCFNLPQAELQQEQSIDWSRNSRVFYSSFDRPRHT